MEKIGGGKENPLKGKIVFSSGSEMWGENKADWTNGVCRICEKETRVKHINLYVSGSEGLYVCQSCEIDIVALIRCLMNVALRGKMVTIYKYKKDKEEEND